MDPESNVSRAAPSLPDAQTWGCGSLSSVWKGGKRTAFKMTCRAPGHIGCTKERSLLRARGQAERLVKTWLMWGAGSLDKGSHAKVWPMVVDAFKCDRLPTDETLDAWVKQYEKGFSHH